MKKNLIDFLVCLRCGKNLSVKEFEREDDEIKEGVLVSDCGEWFPIIDFIPRILMGDLRRTLYRDYPDFFTKYSVRLPKERAFIRQEDFKQATSESFGYEWTKFPRMLKEWEKNFNWYFQPVDLEDLRDKTVLEVGCGKGRHTFYAAKYAKGLFCVDLSRAVDVAQRNNRENKNIHFIQADIFNLPFRPGFFNFAFSLGVLHHLPEPERGFGAILDFLKPGGGILIYVYHKLPAGSFKARLLKAVDLFRKLTTRLPHNILYYLCWPLAIFQYIFIIKPYGVLRKFKTTKGLAESFPLKLYADYPFQVILNDTFDRFSAPIENRYSKEEITGWYERAGLKNIRILAGGGWRIYGTIRLRI